MGSILDLGTKIPRATEQPSLCAATTEPTTPQLESSCAAKKDPPGCNKDPTCCNYALTKPSKLSMAALMQYRQLSSCDTDYLTVKLKYSHPSLSAGGLVPGLYG